MEAIMKLAFQAAFHYQRHGPPLTGDPVSYINVTRATEQLEASMGEYERKGEWMAFYRLLLIRGLVRQVGGGVIFRCVAMTTEHLETDMRECNRT